MFRSPLTAILLAVAAGSLPACGNDSGASNASGGAATGTSCSIDGDCKVGEKCTDGTCRGDKSFSGGDVGSSGGSDGTATDGATADGGGTGGDGAASSGGSSNGSSSGASSGGADGDANQCAACKKDQECAEGYGCVFMFNSDTAGHNFCARKCSGVTDCAPGYACTIASTDSSQQYCVPPNSKCDGCSIGGCKGGQKCDYKKDPPACVQAAAACGDCKTTADCGSGLVCMPVGGKKICAPDCSAGQACPANSICQAFDLGVKLCIYEAETCCYGQSCKKADKCSSCPDKCFAGACVECTKNEHCPDGDCVTGQHTCQKASCPADKPHKQQATGLCVECLNDTHCVGEVCVQNTCQAGSQNNQCAVCKDPYPGCVQINGTWSCVECDKDEQCKAKKAGTCDTKTYTCTGTTTGGGPTSGNCKSDADCTAGTTSFDLACNTSTGLCYDKNGQCDNVTAFCNAAKGSKCVQMADLFGGGGLPGGGSSGGGIPGLPGAGSSGGGGSLPGSGVCSCGGGGSSSGSGCNYSDQLCKTLNLKGCDCCADPKSKACDPLGLGSCCQASGGGSSSGGGSLLGLVQCLTKMQGGGSSPECFGGTTCMPIGCLFAGLGGGSSNKATGYCAGSNAAP